MQTDNALVASTALNTQGPGPAPAVKIDNTLRQAWNNYVDWLETKGLKGHPSLDKNNKGLQMIDEYRKEHPDTPLTRNMVIPIQQEFSNYRNYALNQVEQGKAQLAPGTTKDNFLKSLSQVDGLPGQRTTSYKFPHGYMIDRQKNETNQALLNSDVPIDQQMQALKTPQ